MQYHINPHYLSAGDRLLAKVTNFAVNSNNWSPNFRHFSGLYRCHLCFCIWDSGLALTQHLSSNHGQRFDDPLDNNDEEDDENGLGDEAPLKQFRRQRKRKKSEKESKNQKTEELSSDVAKIDSIDSERVNPAAAPLLSDVATTIVGSDDKLISCVPKEPLVSVENSDVGASRQDESASTEEPAASIKSNETLEDEQNSKIIADLVSNCDKDQTTESVVSESNLSQSETKNAEVIEKSENIATETKKNDETATTEVVTSSPTKSEVVENVRKRPERKCKTTTKALMLLTFTEDYDFAESSSSSSSSSEDESEVVDKNCVQNGPPTCSSTEDTTDMTSSVQSEEGDSSSTR